MDFHNFSSVSHAVCVVCFLSDFLGAYFKRTFNLLFCCEKEGISFCRAKTTKNIGIAIKTKAVHFDIWTAFVLFIFGNLEIKQSIIFDNFLIGKSPNFLIIYAVNFA